MHKSLKGFQLIQLQPIHKADMMLLQQQVLDALPNPRWYFPSEEYEFDQWLLDGDAYGFLKGNTLCGYGVITPAEARGSHSYAAVLNFESAHTFDFHDILVLPAYRGLGMHTELLGLFENMVRAVGGTAIYATIDPENEASWHNFEKAGYVCLCTKSAYDGRPRRYYQLKICPKATEEKHD